MMLNKAGKSAVPRIYVVPTEDGVVEMNALEYKKFLERQQISAPPAQEEPEEEPEKEQQESSPSLNITEWLPFLEEDPEVFVDTLLSKVGAGDEQATSGYNFLLNAENSESIINMLLSLRDSVEDSIKAAIDRICGKKEWLESVISMVKSIGESNE